MIELLIIRIISIIMYKLISKISVYNQLERRAYDWLHSSLPFRMENLVAL